MKIRIVIVDKHAAVRRALRQRLNAAPQLNVIATVREPDAVLPYLNPPEGAEGRADSPDVVLLGLQNGSDQAFIDTLDVVRQLARERVAVIVLASYADDAQQLSLCRAGAAGYLLKNIDSPRLIEEIETVARRGR